MRLIAASVDGVDDAQKMIEAEHLQFPVGVGLDALETARMLGAYYTERDGERFLNPADFIIGPDGKLASTTYSSSAVGRLMGGDAIALIGFMQKKAAGG